MNLSVGKPLPIIERLFYDRLPGEPAGVAEEPAPMTNSRDTILADMEREIEAAVIRARRRLAALESGRVPSHEPIGESTPTLED